MMDRRRRGSPIGAVSSLLVLAGLVLVSLGACWPTCPRRAAGHVLAQGSGVIAIDPASVSVDVGDTTTVDIFIESVTNLDYVDALVTFDPALLEVVDADSGTSGVQIEIGTWFGSASTVDDNDVDQEAGEIYYTQESGGSPVDGDGVLASITFRGKAGGTSAISFDEGYLVVENADYEPIAVDVQDGSVSVTEDGTPVATSTATETPESTAEGTATATVTATQTATPDASPAATSTATPSATPEPSPTAVGRSTPEPTDTPSPSPQPAAAPAVPYETRVMQVWPDRHVGVTSALLEDTTAYADSEVLSFGVLNVPEGGIVRARTYLHFPLNVFPPGTQVKRALLYVYVDSRSGTGEATVGAYRVLDSWTAEGWGGDPAAWVALLDSPVASTGSGRGSAHGSAAKVALAIVPQDSPLTTPTPGSSLLPTPTPEPTATSRPTPKPASTATPAATSSTPATSTPTPVSTAKPASTLPPGAVAVDLDRTNGRWMVWDITALVRAWLAQEVPDYGVALAAAPSPDADPDTAGDLLLARWFAMDDPDTLPYLIADVEIHPVTPTPLPVLPLAGSSAGWGRGWLLLAGAALLLLAWAARRR